MGPRCREDTFYHIWVQLNVLRTKELRSLHALLAKLQLPSHLGPLPSLIGEPAGGSLTADQWRNFPTVVAPLVVTLCSTANLYNCLTCLNSAVVGPVYSRKKPPRPCFAAAREIAAVLQQKKDAAAAARKAKAAAAADPEQGRGKRVRQPTERAAVSHGHSPDVDAGALSEGSSDDEYGINPTQQKPRDHNTPVNLHPDDPGNFLKLCSAIKIFVRESITEPELVIADKLYRECCLELLDLYDPEIIKPNHHYTTHTAHNIRNYGPLHDYKTPNHAGGELESSFFREFRRTVQQSRLLAQGAREPVGSEVRDAVNIMYRATDDDRGTVQDLARHLDLVREDGMIFVSILANH
ncbi:hypothetical protein C8R46DRAFT_1210561 [Mycena filopes]|nr:hypothetical protein C8R46DRAFT_1210561 [Mycena filopes]